MFQLLLGALYAQVSGTQLLLLMPSHLHMPPLSLLLLPPPLLLLLPPLTLMQALWQLLPPLEPGEVELLDEGSERSMLLKSEIDWL